MKHYCLNCGHELMDNQLLCPKCGHCIVIDMAYKQSFEGVEPSELSLGSFLSTYQIETNTQWTKYRCGKDGSTGHGFAAEDANALGDLFKGLDVEFTGRDNKNSGADRTVNGVDYIQTKYYNSASKSVNAAFDNTTGVYKYRTENGVQILEVPKEQYEEAVQLMRQKISEGKVPGHTNPDDAPQIIKRGSVTYNQAKNIAKAGNIDSLRFDAQSNYVSAMSAFGISFTINVALGFLKCNTSEERIEVIQLAFLQGLKNGTITMTSGIANMQLLRTTFGRNMSSFFTTQIKSGVKNIRNSSFGKTLIDKIAKTVNGKELQGTTSINVATKFLRTNAMGNLVLTTVITLPDIYRCFFRKSISNGQFVKNLVVNTTSITGATLGAFLGSALGPYGAIGGGLAAGVAFSWASSTIANIIRKDDAEKMYQLVEVALMQLSHDYLIQSQDEFERCLDFIKENKVLSSKFLRAMYSIGVANNDDELRVQIAYEKLDYSFFTVARQRKTMSISDDYILGSINEIIIPS